MGKKIIDVGSAPSVLRLYVACLFACAQASCALESGEAREGAFELDSHTEALMPPRAEICDAHNGCGAPGDDTPSDPGPVAPPTTPAAPSTSCTNPNNCFGAIGVQCGGAPEPSAWTSSSSLPLTEAFDLLPDNLDYTLLALGCSGSSCWVNAGSWMHDECCAANPTGRWCGGPASASNARCEVSWDRAVTRTLSGLNWRRVVDRCAPFTAAVNFSAYCAPAGTIVASGDTNRCCSGSSRPLELVPGQSRALDDYHRVLAQGVQLELTTLFGLDLVVCGTPAPSAPAPRRPTSPRTCTTEAQCAADENCVQSSSGPRYCAKF
ncbi:MAG: hypothetical protein RLZZ450_4153 [Pseudomonadota bacterium]|jgi:hypothetical protein